MGGGGKTYLAPPPRPPCSDAPNYTYRLSNQFSYTDRIMILVVIYLIHILVEHLWRAQFT